MELEQTKFRIMLVDDDPQRMQMLEQALSAEHHVIVARLNPQADLASEVHLHNPEVIFIDVDAPEKTTLDSLSRISKLQPVPVVLCAAHSDSATARRVVDAGVSAYVVNGLHPDRVSALLEVAVARFEMLQLLRTELSAAKTRLADQRDIEKAKGLLMKRKHLDEAAAFNLLRRMAMDRQQKLGDCARSLLSAAEIL